jgi:hypothetical protein
MSVKEAAQEEVDEQISRALEDPDLEPRSGAFLATDPTKEVTMAMEDSVPLPATSGAIDEEDTLSSEEEVQLPPPGLVIAITGGRRQLRRLHRWKLTGGCNRVPGLDYRLYECVPNNDLTKAEYDDWCHSCWRKGTTPEETAEDDAVHVNSSENSSSGNDSPSSDDPTASEEESSSEDNITEDIYDLLISNARICLL